MKYTKFEEWMLHAPVVTSNGKKGAVGACVGGKVCVYFDDGSDWCMLNEVEFLEEEPSKKKEETSSTIPWEVGQEVYCLLRGKGVVEYIGENEETPYIIGVDFGYTYDSYTIDGKMTDDDKGRALFFSEPVITAELFPPKKPFTPTLKKGQMVVIKGKNCFENGCLRYVYLEQEDRIYTEENSYFLKDDIAAIHCVGEEIKFD